jgi:hypothetical protein
VSRNSFLFNNDLSDEFLFGQSRGDLIAGPGLVIVILKLLLIE